MDRVLSFLSRALFFGFVVIGLGAVIHFFVSYHWIDRSEVAPAPKAMMREATILVFGIDAVAEDQTRRSDAIMVMHVDFDRNRVGVISIPRDTYVYVEGYGDTKVNHAYMYGDTPLLKKTVAHYLGVEIDYVVKFGFTGLVKFVDAIGGVEVSIPHAMTYTDHAGGLHINLKKGVQRLDGQQAVQYLRYRRDRGGDISRIRRQQRFVQDAFYQLAVQFGPREIVGLIRSLSEYVYTDVSSYEVAQLFPVVLTAVQTSNVHVSVLPGVSQRKNGSYYWVVSEEVKKKLVDDTLLGRSNRETD